MNCKYCGKTTDNLSEHEFNGKVCDTCYDKLWDTMSFQDSSAFESAVNKAGLNDAFSVLKRWVDTEFSIVRAYEFKEDSRLKYDRVLVYIAVKEMNVGKLVKFPVIVEVRVIGNYRNGKLKLTVKDDTKSRDIYIYGRVSEGSLVSDSKEIRYVKTDMKWVEKELKEFLK